MLYRIFGTRFAVVTGALGLAAVTAGMASAQQISGAIFTTTQSAGTVNANIYDSKNAVYLNGGPQKNGSALPPGTYYYQVTDPSGNTLLSTDPAVCRQVTVGSNGLFSQSVSVPGCVAHLTGNSYSGNGATTVQLMPYSDTPNPGGEYKAWLIAQNDAFHSCNPIPDVNDPTGAKLDFAASCAKTDNFKVKQTNLPEPSVTVMGSKYYDGNTDGSWQNPPEPVIPGWKVDVTLNPGTPAATTFSTFTGSDGMWGVSVQSGTVVYACEELPPSSTYIQTGPLSGSVTADNLSAAGSNRCWTTAPLASNAAGLDFGNACLGAGGGFTLGYWSNKNGQALINAADLAFLSTLNLRNASGGIFTTTKSSSLASWLLSATATNMAYMLSAQLTAMELNVRHNFVNGSTLIFAPGTSSANVNGFATVNAVMTEAITSLASNGLVLSGNPVRPYQQALKNALDAANNNGTFVQSGPCAFTTPY